MTSEQLRFFLAVRPFKPFTIHIADGSVLEIRHPEMVDVARNGQTMWVYTPHGDDQVLDMFLITRLRVMTDAEMRIPRRR